MVEIERVVARALRRSRWAGARVPEVEAGATAIGQEAPAGPQTALVEALWQDVMGLYGTGLYPAIALHLQWRGAPLLDRAIGFAHGNGPGDAGPRVPATPEGLYCLFSASKAVTALLIHLLDDRGVLHVDDPVAEYIPEFARKGKGWVTIRHLLSHRAGFPNDGGFEPNLDLLADPARIVQTLCDAELDARAGVRPAYLPISGGYILGEVAQRATGRDLQTLLREEITGPLGLRSLRYGVEPEDVGKVARSYYTGPRAPAVMDWAARRALGGGFEEVVGWSNDPRFLTAVVPSGNVVGTPRDVGRFFEMLRRGGELDGQRVMEHRTVRRARNETSYRQADRTFVLPVRYGVGVMLGAQTISPFGPRTTRAFGHIGFSNLLTWADPSRDLTVVFLTTGKPIIAEHLPPLWRFLTRISDGFAG